VPQTWCAIDDAVDHATCDANPLEVWLHGQSNDVNVLLVDGELDGADDAPIDLSHESSSFLGTFGLARGGLDGRPVDGPQRGERGSENICHVGSVPRPSLSDHDSRSLLTHSY
jgi:hypothetical protein